MNVYDLIKADEGFRSLLYDDATGQRVTRGYTLKGNATIGYGWACGINPMTEAEGTLILRPRVDQAADAAVELLGLQAWVRLGEVRQAALTNMVYQLGPAGVRGFALMLDALRQQKWQQAHDHALKSVWAEQTPARARRIAQLLLTGEVR